MQITRGTTHDLRPAFMWAMARLLPDHVWQGVRPQFVSGEEIAVMNANGIATFLSQWNRAAQQTLELIEALPADQYDFRPDPKGRSIGELSRENWIFLVLSGFATGLSWIFYFKALQLGDVSKVAPVDKLSVAIAILLAVVFLGEALTFKTAVGAILIIAIYIQTAILFGVYTPELFPTEIRLRANGICNTLGRGATVVSPFVVGYLMVNYQLPGVIWLMIGLVVVQIIAVYFWGVEPAKRSLEGLDPKVA